MDKRCETVACETDRYDEYVLVRLLLNTYMIYNEFF